MRIASRPPAAVTEPTSRPKSTDRPKPVTHPAAGNEQTRPMRGKAIGLQRQLEADTFRGASAEMLRARMADRLTPPADAVGAAETAPTKPSAGTPPVEETTEPVTPIDLAQPIGEGTSLILPSTPLVESQSFVGTLLDVTV